MSFSKRHLTKLVSFGVEVWSSASASLGGRRQAHKVCIDYLGVCRLRGLMVVCLARAIVHPMFARDRPFNCPPSSTHPDSCSTFAIEQVSTQPGHGTQRKLRPDILGADFMPHRTFLTMHVRDQTCQRSLITRPHSRYGCTDDPF